MIIIKKEKKKIFLATINIQGCRQVYFNHNTIAKSHSGIVYSFVLVSLNHHVICIISMNKACQHITIFYKPALVPLKNLNSLGCIAIFPPQNQHVAPYL